MKGLEIMRPVQIVVVVLACSLLASIACNRSKSSPVPNAVRATLATRYPDADEVEWQKIGDHWEVEFREKDVEVSLILDQTGTILETATEIVPEELPQAIRETLAVRYSDVAVAEAERVEKGYEVLYEVDLTNGSEVLFDRIGGIIEDEPEHADEEGEGADEDDDLGH